MGISHQDRSQQGGLALHRRDLLRGAAAIGAVALLPPSSFAAESGGGYAELPARGEYLIRNAYVLTMDAKLGDLPRATSMCATARSSPSGRASRRRVPR